MSRSRARACTGSCVGGRPPHPSSVAEDDDDAMGTSSEVAGDLRALMRQVEAQADAAGISGLPAVFSGCEVGNGDGKCKSWEFSSMLPCSHGKKYVPILKDRGYVHFWFIS